MSAGDGASAQAVVVGSGAMAPEIAAALAATGTRVCIAGRSPERAEAAAERARGFAGGAGAIAAGPIAARSFTGAALVVETIVEDATEKRELLSTVEGWCGPDTIIATNTSSLRIADLAAALTRPGLFAGLHFLKPAHLTGVVEVIPGPDTAAGVVEVLVGVGEQMGKSPLVVRADEPGFIWNRIQFAVLRECLHMLELGVADAADIDAAVSDGLAPRWVAAGPLATADLGGLSTFTRVSRQLFPHLASGDEVPQELEGRARDGRPFAPWISMSGEAVDALRAEALRGGREIAAMRKAIGG